MFIIRRLVFGNIIKFKVKKKIVSEGIIYSGEKEENVVINAKEDTANK